ncbi:peroxisome biogenesis protein [Salix suchowensis]|nr:peroxisome biogenesis protein [Salix suchowensis]
MIIPGHDFEILCCDWNKYDDRIIATASVDKRIRVWDMWSLVDGLLASTGWDELVYVWQHGTDPRAP